MLCLPSGTVTALQTRSHQSCSLLEALRENRFPCLCQLLEATCTSWLTVPPNLQSQQLGLIESPSEILLLSPGRLLSMPPSQEDPCDYLEPIRIIQDHLPIPESVINICKVPFCHVQWHLQVRRLGHDILGGGSFFSLP